MSADPAFPHLDARGQARMVDVSVKPATLRRARAEGWIRLADATVRAFREGTLAKGDAAALARIAAIQGAKRASDWVPLCHPVRLDGVEVGMEVETGRGVRVDVTVTALDRTGVEMEALAAVSSALLTIYDMVKATDRSASMEMIRLLEKTGGRSGTWRREGTA
jgi:cyclic pyranopterin phosphate synthase